MAQLARLEAALKVCPTDLSARTELASLLERVEQYEKAFSHWNTILSSDPNSLVAREGIARCRERLGRPLPSSR